MKSLAATLVLLALVGCDEPTPCPTSYQNGALVRDRLTGERYVVTNGQPFTNINSGRCSIQVSAPGSYGVISSYRVELDAEGASR